MWIGRYLVYSLRSAFFFVYFLTTTAIVFRDSDSRYVRFPENSLPSTGLLTFISTKEIVVGLG